MTTAEYDANFHHENQGQLINVSQTASYENTTTVNQQREGHSQITYSTPKQTFNTSSNQTMADGVEATHSFDSIAEMSQYFPNEQHADSSSIRHQQGFEGQTYSATTSNRVLPTNINAFNAASHLSVAHLPPTINQTQTRSVAPRLPVQPPNMAHQQTTQQQNVPPSAPRPTLTGIPGHPSQVEGLSVGQELVNDVLVNLQSKMINEDLHDYGETGQDIHFEPIQPIHIQAPQPTLVLQSDYNRLRAELNSRVRPPVVYRYPANANVNNQFQQNASHFNNQQGFHGDFGPGNFGHSDEYRTSSTTFDEQRRENEERLYNQAESALLNTDNVNDNVHGAFERQGLSTTSSDRHASSYPSSSFLPLLEDNQTQQQQQQGSNETSTSYTTQTMDYSNNNLSNVTRSRQEITFDIDNCIARCFEAHRQRVARRRATKQARKARRHRPSNLNQRAQTQYQQNYQTIATEPLYSTLRTTTTTTTQPQFHQPSTENLSTIISQHDTQTISPGETYDYSNATSDYLQQIPYSTIPTDIQQTTASYYQEEQQQVPTEFIDTTSTNIFNHGQTTSQPHLPIYTYPSIDQQQTLDYSDQSISSTEYYPSQRTQPRGTFEYTKESYQLDEPIYTYQGIQPTTSQYPYSIDNLAQQQTYDYSSQGINPSTYYQEQTIAGTFDQIQGTTVQPSGTIDYTSGTYQTQQPDYTTYQNVDETSTNYSYGTDYIQQPDQTNLYQYDGSITATGPYSIIDDATQQATLDGGLNFNTQTATTSQTYQEQTIPQYPDIYTQPNQTIEYTQDSYSSQQPIYNYENLDQQVSQHDYTFDNLQQQDQTNFYSYDAGTSSAAYSIPDIIPSQISQQDIYGGYTNQIQTGTDYYGEQVIPTSQSEIHTGYPQTSGTYEYTTETHQSETPIYTYEDLKQEAIESSQQQQQQTETIEQVDQVTTSQKTADINISTSAKAREPEIQIKSRRESHTSSGSSGAVEYTQHSYYVEEPITDQQTTEIHAEEHEKRKEEVSNVQDKEQRIPEVKKETTESVITETATVPPTQPPVRRKESGKFLPETIAETEEKSETHTESHDTMSSLPPLPPPPPAVDAEETEHHQDSIATNASDFPPPPNQVTTRTTEQRATRDTSTHIPITQQTITFDDDRAQPPPSPSESGSEDSSKIEDEEYFDLRQCIVRCYEKYRATWNQMQDQPYRQDFSTHRIYPCDQYPFQPHQETITTRTTTTYPSGHIEERQPSYQQYTTNYQTYPSTQYVPESYRETRTTGTTTTTYPTGQTFEQYRQQEQPEQPQPHGGAVISHQEVREQRPYYSKGEIHYTDAATQTPALNKICHEYQIHQNYGQTPANYERTTYIPLLGREELAPHTDKQQSIEFSPPLVPRTRYIHHYQQVPVAIPCITDQIEQQPQLEQRQERQQQEETIYDHTSPVPPHLSFNDNVYQPESYIRSPVIPQPRPHYHTHIYKNEEQPQTIQHEEQQHQRYRAHSEPPSIHQESITTIPPLQPFPSPIYEQSTRRAVSIPMIYQPMQQTQTTQTPSIRMLNQGQAYEVDTGLNRRIPVIDQRTGQCLVPCPEAVKYAHLPPHLRPELFCIELPPPGSLPPPPPLPPPPQPTEHIEQTQTYAPREEHVHQHIPHHHGRWCVRCCCVPGRSLIKKVVYRQSQGEKQSHDESYIDYASVIDQMATQITVRYGNSYMEEGEAFVSGGYHEQLRVLDFPVYVSGENDPTLTPLVPTH